MTILIMFLSSTLSCLLPNIISFIVVVYLALFLAFICCFGNISILLNLLTLNGSQETRASLLVGIFPGIESNQKMTQMFEKPMFVLVFTYIQIYNIASYSLFRHTSVSYL